MRLEDEVILAREGDREAFIRLIKQLETNLYRVARAIVKRDEDCADAIQETILKAFQFISAVREPVYFKSWLLRILINECNQIIRRQQRMVLAEPDLTLSACSSEYDKIDVKEAVDRLEDKLRMVVTLYYYEDLPLKQIAELLETTEGTVKSRLHRARLTLAECLRIPAIERKVGYER
ncbi:sigma-70 family RNA polymerase sigma factor [Paenibacillus ginsengarvi]|uniref:Sigma-70 family RNA polymerase sigma factor n=1 Tax=Paenibacillus ginsengarvi TaxID=400777 RepID=A0A3B0CN88_9BACL|nr:sigma-70 family RNA polymerase sigma factor [Paenibacillus ginsengarvi]RKN86208.1 sigma-70 family RNA polymerase sigma factor [Paenibacillus ginsengarvi]